MNTNKGNFLQNCSCTIELYMNIKIVIFMFDPKNYLLFIQVQWSGCISHLSYFNVVLVFKGFLLL